MFGDSSVNLHINFDNSTANATSDEFRRQIEDILEAAGLPSEVIVVSAVIKRRPGLSASQRAELERDIAEVGNARYEGARFQATLWATPTRFVVEPDRDTPLRRAEFPTLDEAIAFCDEWERGMTREPVTATAVTPEDEMDAAWDAAFDDAYAAFE